MKLGPDIFKLFKNGDHGQMGFLSTPPPKKKAILQHKESRECKNIRKGVLGTKHFEKQ